MKMIMYLMERRILFVCKLLIIFLIVLSCEKEEKKPDIYFPVGRISVLNNDLTVTKNNQEVIYELVFDNCGGYWLKFDGSQFAVDDELIIKFTRTDQQTEEFIDTTLLGNWLSASYFIDCDNDTVVSKAQEITAGLSSNMEKAIAIHQFMLENMEFSLDYYEKPTLLIASQTLEGGIIGICINFSRLYVALCRAAGVPARTIWGVVYGSTDDGIYNYHHQWAEVCDDDGIWYACDFTYREGFFNNDMRYIDLFYCAEENLKIIEDPECMSLFGEVGVWNGCVFVGSLGFELIADNRPDSMVVERVVRF
jgi:hypothetical protein